MMGIWFRGMDGLGSGMTCLLRWMLRFPRIEVFLFTFSLTLLVQEYKNKRKEKEKEKGKKKKRKVEEEDHRPSQGREQKSTHLAPPFSFIRLTSSIHPSTDKQTEKSKNRRKENKIIERKMRRGSEAFPSLPRSK